MAGELLGLVVVWALIFTLPIVVAWVAIRIVVTAREGLETRRTAQPSRGSRGAILEASSGVPESGSDPDVRNTDRDDRPSTATSTTREQP